MQALVGQTLVVPVDGVLFIKQNALLVVEECIFVIKFSPALLWSLSGEGRFVEFRRDVASRSGGMFRLNDITGYCPETPFWGPTPLQSGSRGGPLWLGGPCAKYRAL